MELLRVMVEIDSVNAAISGRAEAERSLAEAMERIATAMGLATRRLPVPGRGFNLLVTHEVQPGGPWLLFQSHLDTVGVEGMTIEPFAAQVRQGRMYGRGACDTKSSGAAMLWALRLYAQQGGGPNNVAVLFSIDEEIGKAGITAFVEEHLPALGWTLNGCVVGEPTRLRLITAHNGVVRWAIRTQGRAAHSSNPSLGRSAIRDMVRVIEAIESRYIARLEAHHPLTGPAACSINLIRGGMQINVIPDRCEIQLDRRVVPGESAQAVLPEVERILDELRAEDAGLEVSQGEPFIDPPLDPSYSTAWSARVGRVLADLGLDATPAGVRFGTDACALGSPERPTIVLGPGDIDQAHTADEWIALDQVEQAVTVYLNLMRSSPGGDDERG
ncbi:MAG TPA: M20 family metallopeptidase [Phycisphaeraceae bacterium]